MTVNSEQSPQLQETKANFNPNLKGRYRFDRVFKTISWIATFAGIVVLTVLLIGILVSGLSSLSFDFIVNPPSRKPEIAGIWPPLIGTICLLVITALFAFPVGVGSGIFLEEFSEDNLFAKAVEINISNLAAVPSIIYGLLGLFVFARIFEPVTGGRSLLSGGLTLALLILPVIIVATREALRAVPDSLRLAGMALGATRWQTVRSHVLPQALPGIMTGTILALSRAIGETAPLIVVGAATFVPFAPELSIKGLQSSFTAMPIQIFSWVSRPQDGFHEIAAGAIIVLMLVLLVMNGSAIWLRNKFQSNR
ncbi:MAG: phosphate ABC transporter permease PstA [Leptolyngbyaceae cyanobacterium SM1_1_3]|nr:phosphate ABC transporter permease PstA [Leptolyngbyaceae cyanobacterium SM1_1_3]NJM85095.1 phosphate ABC transporter permease PstA [Leptolyngbyaceae cyanobacterium RM2_2_21]NJN02145.1 phosphate ABC transporter permease PstA [Leptolyngbyaceae cyanobacterium RM1_1_2]NJO08972.1 phosphate ABC transporter permease PstA [Leptolyngbyaceae cyanobacterium SL_1_1]